MSKDHSGSASHVNSPSDGNKSTFLNSANVPSESRPSHVSLYGRLPRSSPYTRAGSMSRRGQSPLNTALHSQTQGAELPTTAPSVLAQRPTPSYASPYVQNRSRLHSNISPPSTTVSSQPSPAALVPPQPIRVLGVSQPAPATTLRPISSFQPTFILPPPSGPSGSAKPLAPKKPEVHPMNLRPKVLTKDRLASWTTPFGIKRRQEAALGFLPSHAVDKAYNLVADSLEESSKTTYGAGLLRFTQFCDEHDIDEEKRMPAHPDLVAAFVASAAGSVSGSTIKAWLSGLRAWHIFNKAPWSEDEFLSLVRTASKKIGQPKKRPPRAPVSLRHLELLLDSLDIVACREDAALWACATTTFFGCRRLGETTLSLPPFNAYRHVSRGGDISLRGEEGSIVVDSICIHLPWTKTTKDAGGKIILTRRNDRLCPIFALRNHFELNAIKEGEVAKDISLFAFRNYTREFRQMYKSEFLERVQAIWKKHPELDQVSGHSFRIGGAVTLLMAGVEPEVVAATGGWTSMAFLLYWRKLEVIVPQFTAKAYGGGDSEWASVNAKLDRLRKADGLSTAIADASETL
ncbi:hypothetical protein CVT24_012455 [Panaeolus cyanescens]|uniref:Tyr recombinase domain-containing protein n=1 Tax=Panaeolus cyanescens TaxID=181874 RepID=A0A409X171_9AGAR|nr:hypothetical protein CVT24_012455 [Panaeolus cyanescens]